eukprot:CAMPEP_0113627758 /NCGR_PEP_ID=MMETSP0017_2-20120614/14379_1 /TAXON_ID=2856 /ORGANISM="Cylindrotheca closterium" /LENGTH=945 /DNA_ID=CAMNT_0000538031 /DNA_START=107 /DNA_END=2944 /DNA_ORIENTATION=+ /assembly_acc=CAM_ASM_000147
MRMGKVERPRRGETNPPRADSKGKPKHAAAASVVGQLSPDVVSIYFSPVLTELAVQALENYAANLLEYDDIVRDMEAMKEKQADVAADGSIRGIEPPEPPIAPLYRSEYYVKELRQVLSETSDHFHSRKGGWRVHARAARFERLMDEKYGIFRPFLKQYPEVDKFVRSVQVKYANGYFSPIRQGKSPIPKSTAVIILFMMKRGDIKWEILTLSALFFLVGLQPWALVILIAGGHTLLEGRKKRAVKPMETYIPTVKPYFRMNRDEVSSRQTKIDLLSRPVGKKHVAGEIIDMMKYDTIILGSGPDALYTASLLSRAGRKVLVMTARSDASGCYTIEDCNSGEAKKFDNVPFDVCSSNISKISGQQELLAPALSNSTDYQGGVRFAKIGSETDGYAFQILSVPGMGSDEVADTPCPFVLRGDGVSSLMEDAAASLGDGWPDASGSIGNSATGLYSATCESINSSAAHYYLSKILEDSVNEMRSDGVYHSAASRYASGFLGKGFASNPHARSLMAAIGMNEENIEPTMTSMAAHVTNVSAALSGEGMHYPIGGPRALCHALSTVVEQSGGCVLTNVPVTELIFEHLNAVASNEKDGKEKPAPQCLGVKLSDGTELKFDTKSWKSRDYSPAVISMHGFITTFIRLMPDDIRTKYKVPRGLPALSESRPVFKLLFGLRGSAKDLEVTGIDFCRVPGAGLVQDELDPTDGQRIDNVIPGDINQESKDATNVAAVKGKHNNEAKELKKAVDKSHVRFETGASWMKISFPSAKDPSFESRHGNITTCVVTVEADDDFVSLFETKPRLFTSQSDQGNATQYQVLIDRIKCDLLNVFPQLEGKIVCSQLIGPIYRGLSHNPERYVAKGVRPQSQYPGLFAGGSDLTVGGSFSASIVAGWLTANAVMGYSAIDYLFLQKNITSDLINFLEEPDVEDEEDTAVPYDIPKSELSASS